MKAGKLLILPSVKVWRRDEKYVFDRKYFDGMLKYIEYWPGPVGCVMSLSGGRLPEYGVVERGVNELPFSLQIINGNDRVSCSDIDSAAVVLASGDSFSQFHVANLCRSKGVRCVYIIEYIPETRYQINKFSSPNILVQWRRAAYIWRGELRRRKAFQLADGIQANGVAAFNHYKDLNKPLLYFDTRVSREDLISRATLVCKLSKADFKPVRLGYSGRLERLKGADHLVPLALELRRRGISFSLDIYGTGSLSRDMELAIVENDLSELVRMHGSVDFKRELLPVVKQHVDIFIMLHRQSDPSCTYLETLSCGVPILGYKNKALSGLLTMGDVGWGAEMDDLKGVVDILESILGGRDCLRSKSMAALELAERYSFEMVFKSRIDHLLSVSTPSVA